MQLNLHDFLRLLKQKDLLIDEKRKIVKNTAIAWHDYKGILVEIELLPATRESDAGNSRCL